MGKPMGSNGVVGIIILRLTKYSPALVDAKKTVTK
jgi:hypothetical protein